ncbi:hypothetical protein [Microbulbifer elongatus]
MPTRSTVKGIAAAPYW